MQNKGFNKKSSSAHLTLLHVSVEYLILIGQSQKVIPR